MQENSTRNSYAYIYFELSMGILSECSGSFNSGVEEREMEKREEDEHKNMNRKRNERRWTKEYEDKRSWIEERG